MVGISPPELGFPGLALICNHINAPWFTPPPLREGVPQTHPLREACRTKDMPLSFFLVACNKKKEHQAEAVVVVQLLSIAEQP